MKTITLIFILTLVGSAFSQGCASNELLDANGDCVLCSSLFGDFCDQCDLLNGCTNCYLLADDFITCFDPKTQCKSGEYAILDAINGYGICAECQADIPKCASCASVYDSNLLTITLPGCTTLCQANEYVDVDLGQCVSCSQYCSSCQSAGTCDPDSCDLDYSVQNAGTSDCDPLPACQSNQYGVPANCQNCDATNPGCTVSCTDGNSCTECEANKYVLGGQCVDCNLPTQIIDGVNCIDCSVIPNCVNCNGLTECTLCADGFYVQNGQCTDTCGVDFTTFVYQNIECKSCDFNNPNCQICEGENQCQVCDQSVELYLVKDGKCSTDCSETDRFNFFDIYCFLCSEFTGQSACIQCNDFGCTDCGAEFVKLGECVADCNDGTSGYYAFQGLCLECASVLGADCLACTDSATCTDCNGKLIQDGQCTDSCSDGYFQSGLNCLKCSDTLTSQCLKCSDANTCTDCDGQFIFNGQCQATCDQAENYAEGLNCLACTDALGAFCLSCDSATTCDDCGANNFIRDGQCTTECTDADRFVFNSVYCNLCSDHITNCVACDSETSCTDCNGQYIKDGLCSEDCSDLDRYIDALNCLKCSDAIADCLACSDANTCTDCGAKFIFYGNACVDNCDAAELYAVGNSCFRCSDNLDHCISCDQADECLDCDGWFIKDKLCSETCDDSDRFVEGLNCLVCGDYIADCQACSDRDTCTDCGTKFIKEGQCVETCGSGYYQNEATHTCDPCDKETYHCVECSQGTTICDACDEANGWYNDVVEGQKQTYCVNYNPNCDQPGNTCDFYLSTKLYAPQSKACYHGHCFVAQWTPRHLYPDGSGEADIPDLFGAAFAWKVINYDVNCCNAEAFNPNRVYDTGKLAIYNGVCYRAKYYTSTKGWTTEFQFYAWDVVPANDKAKQC